MNSPSSTNKPRLSDTNKIVVGGRSIPTITPGPNAPKGPAAQRESALNSAMMPERTDRPKR